MHGRAARAPARVRVGREVAGRGGKARLGDQRPAARCRPRWRELATRLKKLCGAGGAVRDGAIEIQGEHRDRLVAELLKLGYDGAPRRAADTRGCAG